VADILDESGPRKLQSGLRAMAAQRTHSAANTHWLPAGEYGNCRRRVTATVTSTGPATGTAAQDRPDSLLRFCAVQIIRQIDKMIVFPNGRFVPERRRCSVFDRSFLYGDGLFEVAAFMAARLSGGRNISTVSAGRGVSKNPGPVRKGDLRNRRCSSSNATGCRIPAAPDALARRGIAGIFARGADSPAWS